MANIRLIKGRIKSAKNIAQITKAMELVAASKMKKAQARALSGKLYAQKIYDMVMELSDRIGTSTHPLLQKKAHESGRKLVIFISTNKGLCGGLNTNLFRYYLQSHSDARLIDAVTMGHKGASFLTQTGATIKADFSNVSSFMSVVPAVIELLSKEYSNGAYDEVELVFNEFLTIMHQEPRRKTILPLTLEQKTAASTKAPGMLSIEPNVKDVFDALIPHYLENQLRDAILEAEASEHSARMLAMRNATDNANALTDDLTLVYNKARQEKITYEISDIITATLGLSA